MKQIVFVLLPTLLLCSLGMGQTPQLMSHQGYVADSTGTGIIGTLPMIFRMFNDSTGGSAILTQSFPSVTLTKGVFNVNLDVSTLSFSSQYWLETEVNSQTLTPRTRLTSAPYSLAPWATSGTNVYYKGGNVGIGTTSPSDILNAVGDGVDAMIALDSYGSGTRLMGRHANGSKAFPTACVPGDLLLSLRGIGYDGSNFGISADAAIAFRANQIFTPTAKGTYMVFNTTPDGSNGSLERMRITDAGNVGIGTTNPAYKLDVNGAVNATSLLVNGIPAGGSQWTTSGSNIYYNSGNVGIGTSSPAAKLDVNGPIKIGNSEYGSSVELAGYGTGDRTSYIDFRASDAQPDWSTRIIRNAGANGETEIATLGTGVLRMRTWTPGSSLRFNVANLGDMMTVTSTGVGIGTTSPTDKLSIQGTGNEAITIRSSVGNYTVRGMLKFGTTDQNYQDQWAGIASWSEGGLDQASLSFYTSYGSRQERMFIKATGEVGIGTNNPQSKLAVNGTITARQVDVTLNGWSDFVFDDDYELLSLEKVEEHIKQFKHLPDVPSEKEVLHNGVDLGKMQSTLLQKIEELTLHAIAQHKLIEKQAAVLKAVQQQLVELQKEGR